jgi:hypothetical protein
MGFCKFFPLKNSIVRNPEGQNLKRVFLQPPILSGRQSKNFTQAAVFDRIHKNFIAAEK